MPVSFVCPQCNFQGNVPEEFQGKKIRCKKCGTTSAVPAPLAPARPKPPPPLATFQVPAVITEPTKPCNFCGATIPEKAEQCTRCGEHLIVIVPEILPVKIERTKACAFCGEEVLEVAKKCKHCGELLDPALRAAEENRRLAAMMATQRPTHVTVNTSASATAASSNSSSFGCGCFLLGLALFFLFLVLFS